MTRKADLSRHAQIATPHTPASKTGAESDPRLTQTSIGPLPDSLLNLQQTVGNHEVSRLLAGTSRPTAVQRASTKVSMPGLGSGGSGKDSGGDGNGEKEKKSDQFVGLEHMKPAREAEEAYRAYFEENQARIQNVFNSRIGQYNANPLMGAALFQLFHAINQRRAALMQAYERAGDYAYHDALEEGASDEAHASNEMALEVLGQEGQALRTLDGIAQEFLNALIDFFQPYQDFVHGHEDNPSNRPVGGSHFAPVPFAPYAAHLTVAEAMLAQQQIDARIILTNLGKPQPPPGGDASGRSRFPGKPK